MYHWLKEKHKSIVFTMTTELFKQKTKIYLKVVSSVDFIFDGFAMNEWMAKNGSLKCKLFCSQIETTK